MENRNNWLLLALFTPAFVVFMAFFLLPLARLAVESAMGPSGVGIYLAAITTPRYFETLVYTILLSAGVTLVTLAISGVTGVFLTRNDFPGKSLLVSMLTFPLAFPGVVVGFMIILLVGRQGLIGDITRFATGEKVVLAYSMTGLFLGYLYFSIPRTITTIMASAEKLDRSLEEAARSLGASPWRVIRDVLIPALVPGSDLLGGDLLCDLHGRLRDRVHPGDEHRRAAHPDLHRVHPDREHRDGRRAVDRAGGDHLGGAVGGARRRRQQRRRGRLR